MPRQRLMPTCEPCFGECRAAHCRLPWNGRRPLRLPTVATRRPWFDHLIACVIWRWRASRYLSVTGYMPCNIFDMIFNKGSYYGEHKPEFHFILYIPDIFKFDTSLWITEYEILFHGDRKCVCNCSVFICVEFIFSLFNVAVQRQSLERKRKEAALPNLSCCL
jgi:hypothetical protein